MAFPTKELKILLSVKEPDKNHLWLRPHLDRDGYDLLYWGNNGWTILDLCHHKHIHEKIDILTHGKKNFNELNMCSSISIETDDIIEAINERISELERRIVGIGTGNNCDCEEKIEDIKNEISNLKIKLDALKDRFNNFEDNSIKEERIINIENKIENINKYKYLYYEIIIGQELINDEYELISDSKEDDYCKIIIINNKKDNNIFFDNVNNSEEIFIKIINNSEKKLFCYSAKEISDCYIKQGDYNILHLRLFENYYYGRWIIDNYIPNIPCKKIDFVINELSDLNENDSFYYLKKDIITLKLNKTNYEFNALFEFDEDITNFYRDNITIIDNINGYGFADPIFYDIDGNEFASSLSSIDLENRGRIVYRYPLLKGRGDLDTYNKSFITLSSNGKITNGSKCKICNIKNLRKIESNICYKVENKPKIDCSIYLGRKDLYYQ